MDCYDFVPKVDHPAQIISGATATLGLRCLFTSEDYDCHGLSKEVRIGLIFWGAKCRATRCRFQHPSKGESSSSLVVDDCARQREPESLMGARGRPRRTESGEVEIGGCHRDQMPSDAELVQSARPPCSILRQTLLPHAGSAPDTSRRHLRIPRRRLRENEPA